MGFPRQGNWSGLPFSSPGNLPDPGIEPWSFALASSFFTTEPPLRIICTLFHAGFISSFLASILFECCYLLFYRKLAETSKEALLCTVFFIFMEVKPNEIDYKGELGCVKEESLWPLWPLSVWLPHLSIHHKRCFFCCCSCHSLMERNLKIFKYALLSFSAAFSVLIAPSWKWMTG